MSGRNVTETLSSLGWGTCLHNNTAQMAFFILTGNFSCYVICSEGLELVYKSDKGIISPECSSAEDFTGYTVVQSYTDTALG